MILWFAWVFKVAGALDAMGEPGSEGEVMDVDPERPGNNTKDSACSDPLRSIEAQAGAGATQGPQGQWTTGQTFRQERPEEQEHHELQGTESGSSGPKAGSGKRGPGGHHHQRTLSSKGLRRREKAAQPARIPEGVRGRRPLSPTEAGDKA